MSDVVIALISFGVAFIGGIYLASRFPYYDMPYLFRKYVLRRPDPPAKPWDMPPQAFGIRSERDE